MQVVETNADGLKHDFKVVIPAADIEQKVEHRLHELAQSVRIPGFRPGKIPLSLLKKRYGQPVMDEIIEQTVADSTTRTMSERNLRPATRPKIEITPFSEGQDLEFTMAVEVLPEIEPMDFSKLKLERLQADVEDSEVEQALERIAAQHRRSEPIKGSRKARKGDILVLDFVGKIDGEPFEGGTNTDFHLELGSDMFIAGFEDQLIGARPGERTQVKVTFPEDYVSDRLAGKEASFDVEVKELRAVAPVAVDDALAQTMGLDNLAELKAKMREQIEREHGMLSRARLKRQLLDQLAAVHDFTVPQGMVDAEFEIIWTRIEEAMGKGALDPADAGKSEDELKAEYRSIAERRVRLGLLMSEVGGQNNISLSAEELNQAVMDEARRHPGQERQILEFYRNNPEAMDRLRAPLFEDKVVDFIVEMAQIEERKVSAAELVSEPEEQPPAAPQTGKKQAKKPSKPKPEAPHSKKTSKPRKKISKLEE